MVHDLQVTKHLFTLSCIFLLAFFHSVRGNFPLNCLQLVYVCVCVCTLICAYIKKKEGEKKSFPVLISFVNNLLQSRVCRNTILLWLCFLSLVLGVFGTESLFQFLEAGVDGQ